MKYPFFIRKIKLFINYHLLKFFTNKKFRDEFDIIFKYFVKIRSPKYRLMSDVGAHFGEVSYNFLKIGFKVYAFEPDLNPYKIESLNNLIIFIYRN